jgi:hypothetical protein
MAFTFSGGTATVGATEFSIAANANFSSGSPQTTQAYVQAFINFSALASGDQFRVKIYEKVNGGTQTLTLDPALPTGAQNQLFVTPMLILGEGWDITVQKVSGTDRSVSFSVRKDDTTASVTLGAGSITASTFAANAIDSNAVATSAVTEIQTGLATSAALALVQTDTTTLTTRLSNVRANGLDNLDTTISSRAASSTAVSNVDLTPTRSAKLDQLDVATSTRAPAATAVSNVDYTSGRAVKLDQLDVSVSSRASASTAVSNVDYTPTRATKLDSLDTTISSRASAADYTTVRAAKLDNLDVASSSRAPASTAVSSVDLTPTRSAKLDNLDAAVTTRADAAEYTAPRAALLDNLSFLDASVTSRASSTAVATVSTAVTNIQADTDNIQTRLPASLDSGNMRASVQSLTAESITVSAVTADLLSAIAEAVMGSFVESTITVTGAIRALLAEAVGKVSGFLSNTPKFRDTTDSKNRITGVTTTDGRTSVTLDLT